jgi:transcriptional regulator with XRE-family HTH domain
MEEKRKFIGERIKKARRNAGLTQTELGDKLSLGLRHIQKIEKGETGLNIERLGEISSALNVPLAYFLMEEQDEEGISLDLSQDGQTQYSKKRPMRDPVDGIICEYTRNEETLRLIFPPSISTEDLKEKVEVLVKGIFGVRIQEKGELNK